MNDEHDVLEDNVSTLLESGGPRPQIAPEAKARIRAGLIARHGVNARRPIFAIGLGLAAAVAAVLVIFRFTGPAPQPVAPPREEVQQVAGAEIVRGPDAAITELGPRHLRVTGAALIDVEPGHGAFTVETPQGRIDVRGTRFLVDASPDRTTTAVVRGEVMLATSAGDVTLHAGEQAIAEPGHPPVRSPAPRLSHLVSWAREARHRAEQASAVHHGTLFARDPNMVARPPWGTEYPLPIARLGVDVVVEDQVARVALDQTFHNDQPQVLEGMYRFAIPPDAALQRLAMYVDGRLVESGVVERMAARRIYEELVYRRVDPALLEWAGTGRLALRVYPIPARQDKRLMVAYTQSLPSLYQDYTLSIPLPEVDQPVGTLDVAVRVKDCAGCELSSTSHQITVTRDGNDAVVHYQRAGETIGDSFVLRVRDPRGGLTVSESKHGDEQYLMVRAPAELGNQPVAYRPRTWVILDDVSASRGKLELQAQTDVIDGLLHELDERDRVAVVAFDVEARTKLGLTQVIDVDRRALRKALAGEGGVGATDLGRGLDAAMPLLANVGADDASVIYVGDGVITSGARNLDALRARLVGHAHFIGVGIGDGPDTQTLQGLAGATGGYATTIDLSDDVGWRTFDLVSTLHTQRVTGLTAQVLDAGGQPVAATAYLGESQLADGEQLELVAKIARGAPAAIELHGLLNGAPWQKRIELGTARHGDAGYLPRLWAQRHIAARLLAKHEPAPPCDPTPKHLCPSEADAREARDEQIRREVVALGKQYFLLSRHTSLLVLENDAMYAQYGVAKGSGETWAPYAMPAKIPVVTAPITAPVAPGAPITAPTTASVDGELVRPAMQLFYNVAPNRRIRDQVGAALEAETKPAAGPTRADKDRNLDRSGDDDTARAEKSLDAAAGEGAARDTAVAQIATAQRLISHGVAQPLATPPSASAAPSAPAAVSTSQAGAGSASAQAPPPPASAAEAAPPTANLRVSGSDKTVPDDVLARRKVRMPGIALGHATSDTLDIGAGTRATSIAAMSLELPIPLRYTQAQDRGYDDLTGFVPALFPDDADAWRAQLTPGKHTLDPAAAQLLTAARAALPAGLYHWNNFDLAVDAAHHFAWRRTTEAGLDEIALFDGTSWRRRYPELGLEVARSIVTDDVALGLGYFPLWIADPSHYAAAYDVSLRGPHEVVLSHRDHDKLVPQLILAFDDQARLRSITSGKGEPLVELTWTAGLSGARLGGEPITVGFSAQPVADAAQWAASTDPLVTIDLPLHPVAYWDARLTSLPEGPDRTYAIRQRIASLVATGNAGAVWPAYRDLRPLQQRGDLALASSGIAVAPPQTIGTLDDSPIAQYLIAGRAYRTWDVTARTVTKLTVTPPASLAPGLVRSLWHLRAATAFAAADSSKRAAEHVLSIGERAPLLQLIGAGALAASWSVAGPDLARVWDGIAAGPYRNVARAAAARVLLQRGQSEEAATRITALVNDLDLAAPPPRLDGLAYAFLNTRRGDAGWQLVWSTWRDRVQTSGSYDHVMALIAANDNSATELDSLFDRAATLAGTDPTRMVNVAREATRFGRTAWAEAHLRPLATAHPSHDLYQLLAGLELSQRRTSDALTDLEAAQAAATDEPTDLAQLRVEYTQLLAVAQLLAVNATGPARQAAVTRALTWGNRWRAVDPANSELDRHLGALLLSVGDTQAAWRQLSTVIERDPWSGAGYELVADTLEHQGQVAASLDYWQLAIVIDQTDPTPRLRKAQALIALGKTAEGDALLAEIVHRKWHPNWEGVVYQAQELLSESHR